MHNCIILGSGRSGTSMASGVLSQCGYFMGNNLYSPDIANPKGYFEDQEINGINEDLLSKVVPKRPSGIIGSFFFRKRTAYWQHWLAKVPLYVSISSTHHLTERIKKVTQNEPFCFKDPRFCYTLSVWRPLITDTVFLCVFRHPGETAASIVKEAKRDSESRGISLDFNIKDSLELWKLMYEHILKIHYPQGGKWLFAHYNMFLDGSVFDNLEKLLDIKVNLNFVDSKLRRSSSEGIIISQSILSIYHQLCELAEYKEKL